ncbi:MAG: hypothetical protein P8Y70_01560 [Candidatus Lokiarchaeota archaeon]
MKLKKKNKKRYFAILIVQDSDNSFSIINSKEINPTVQEVKFKEYQDNCFPIDISYPTYSNGLNQYYFINFHTTTQLLLYQPNSDNNKNTVIDSEIVDLLIHKKIIKQLTTSLEPNKFDWKQFLFGLMSGIASVTVVFFILINVMKVS